MAKRHGGKRKGGPRFPQKRWAAGQAPHVETPAKGKGSYRRGKGGGAGDAAGVIDEALENRHRPHDGDA
jgi:hypothetical protein